MSTSKVSGNIVDPVAKRIFSGVISIGEQGVISGIEERQEVDTDRFIIPGFVDAHVHVESSMLIPSEFARLAVCHGTVGTVSDPHEIGNVMGVEGVEFMIRNAATVPFKFCFGAPSCVPATPFETAGAEIGVEEVGQLLAMPEIGYLAEVMDFPGVIAGNELLLAKIKLAKQLGKPVDGHAPGVRGVDAEKYAAAGISTDHECFTREEALDKLRCGMKILIREGSAAKNFDALISLLDEFPDRIMFCSDDKHPNDLVTGHINLLARRAVKYGADPMNVIRACSYNVINHYGLDIGLLQSGQAADFAVVDNLTDFNALETYINGELVAAHNQTKIISVDEAAINHFNAAPVSLSSIRVKAEQKEVNVIEVSDGQLITKKIVKRPAVKDGYLISLPKQDVLKIVVVNRYEKNAAPAIGFVSNFGLQRGAIASSVAHDSHNIIAVGAADEDIVNAINALVECQGGVSLADGKEIETLDLPVAGIMTNRCGYQTAEAYEALDQAAKQLGSNLNSPYMTLSFCALLVIPELKLSDKGLFDGNEFRFRSLFER